MAGRQRYDPDSLDSRVTQILTRMDVQDGMLVRIEEGVTKTNGRVTKLEKWRDIVTAKAALIASAVSFVIGLAGWLFFH